MIARWIVTGLAAWFLVSAGLADEPTSKTKKAAPIPSDEENLDANQKQKIKNLQKMFAKLYGHNLSKVPANAKDLVRDTVYTALSGAHKPERARTDKLANDLMDQLSAQGLKAEVGHRIVKESANALGELNLTKEDRDRVLASMRDMFDSSSVAAQVRELFQADVEELFRTAKRNDKYIADRDAARDAEAEDKLKKAAEKEEKEKKKTKKTGTRRSSRRSSSSRKVN